MGSDRTAHGNQASFSGRINRRRLVTAGSALAAGAHLGALPRFATAARQGGQLSGSIRFQAAHYTPSESMERSATNPIPIKAMQDAVDAYRAVQPNVEVEFVRVPEGTEARVWTVTQLTGGTAPDIVWTQSFDTNRDVGKDWWTNLNPYMEEPNPYVEAGQPGSERWVDQFFESPTAAKYAPNGELYVVPYDLVTTFFFYNKSHFEAAAVEIPTTYAGMIDVFAKLQESGVPVFNGMNWSRTQIGEMVIGVWKNEIEATGGGGSLTQKDMALAILDGVYDATKPEYKEWLRLIKDSVPYWAEQWPAEDAADIFERQFTQGQLAIFEDGSWRFGQLRANTELQFEWGSFFMPILEKGTGPGLSELATGDPPPAIGGATAAQYGIPTTAEENGTLEVVIDFLRFITAPTQAGPIIAELGQFLPNIKGVEVNEDLQGPLEAVTSGVGEAGMVAYGDEIEPEAATRIATATNNYLLDRAELDATAEEIQGLLYAQAEAVAEANGWR